MAEAPVKSTVITTSTNGVVAGPGNFYGVTADGSVAAWTVTIYDNATAQSGTKIFQIGGASASPGSVTLFPNFVPFHAGMSVTVTNAPSVTIYFNA